MASGPTSGLLKKLGINIPDAGPPITPEQQKLIDAQAIEAQSKDPLWKKLGRGAVESVAGAVQGMFGVEPKSINEAGPADYANLGGQVLTSGLPFASYKKLLPRGKVFHGTPKTFEKFDPSKYDVDDTLGWMTHFAEEPAYAGRYATGSSKHGTHMGGPANVIPAEPQSKNVLDLVDPNPDDISAALAALDPVERSVLVKRFKKIKQEVREGVHPDERSYYASTKHYPTGFPKGEEATRAIAEGIRLTPESFKKTPFDAIRYRDMGEKSWAIPSGTNIKTPWGTPLTEETTPLKMFRHDKSGGGTLEVSSDRWENTPLSLPDTPYPETSKFSKLANQFKVGDNLDIITPSGNTFNVTIKNNTDYNELAYYLELGSKVEKKGVGGFGTQKSSDAKYGNLSFEQKLDDAFKEVGNKPTAKFAFDQDDFEGGSFPMYNIIGGPSDKSTVSAETLKEMGIDIPGLGPSKELMNAKLFSPDKILDKYTSGEIDFVNAQELYDEWFSYVNPKDFPKSFGSFKVSKKQK